jgi:DNA polymerase-1
MMGDSADNIPGIPGVGKKTAQKFIAEYESMEGLFENTHQLKGKMKEKVDEGREMGLLSKKLVTIITDVPIEFNEKELRVEPKDKQAIQALFEELEFRTLLPRVLSSKSDNQNQNNISNEPITGNIGGQMDLFAITTAKQNNETPLPDSYKLVDDLELAQKFFHKIKKEKKIAIKLCCSSPNSIDTEILGVSVCNQKQDSTFISIPEKDILSLIKPIIEDENKTIVGYDLKFQLKVLSKHNVKPNASLFDVGVAHYLLNPDMRHDLDILSENHLNMNIKTKKELLGKGKSKKEVVEIEIKQLANFFNQQTDVIFQLQEIFQKQLEKIKLQDLLKEIEMPLTKVLANMEIQGVRIDEKKLSDYAIVLTEQIDSINEKIYQLSEEKFNIGSPKQLGEILFEKMKLSKKSKKTKSGQYSTSEETLLKLKDKHPIIQQILEYREIKKLLSTYILALPELINSKTQRIHTTFNQSVAATGRLSSINPNLQNIPIRTERGRKIREAFIPRSNDFVLLAADYSQIELRIMASLSKDKGMFNAFNDGVDIHSATAAKVYKVPLEEVDRTMRSNAKSVNFGIIYGISAFGLSQNIGVTRPEAKQIIDEYFQQFPKVKIYMEWSIEKARENEFVETILGRRRYLKDINSRNGMLRAMAERNAINAPIQGSAADIIKKAMIKVQREINIRGMQSKMLLQVHDELVFDMHKSEEIELKTMVKEQMEQAVELSVPIIVDLGVGDNWLKAH